ncbi:MAG: methyltransferase type 12 [Caulobacter sp.]|nr:methyltransferase type 12 [Caulobacter sp.]
MAYLRWRRFLELAALDHPWVGETFMRRGGAGPGARPAAYWDRLHSGGYDRLLNSEQRHHHRLLAALVSESVAHPRVLDIGCGEGVFHDSLRPFAPAAYLGVDLSDLAIAKARARITDPAARFTLGDGARYDAGAERFDAIVFPECIEYLGDPIALLDHYARFLAPGGVFGVTQWLGLKPLRLWRQVKAAADIVDEAVVSAPWGGAWQVWTCKPRG